MQHWEYCEVRWVPDRITCSVYSARGFEKRALEPILWGQLLADLGNQGWEMTGVTSSPMQEHEYYFYFKRPFVNSQ